MSQAGTFSSGSGASAIETITGNTGTPVVPTAGNVNIIGAGNITTAGAASTLTITLTGTTDHAVQVGNAGGSLTSIGVGATGTVLIGSTGADPSFSATPSVTSITIVNAPVAGTDGTNKAYVDMIAAGFDFKNSCVAGTTVDLNATYLNGAAGVGATLTNAGALAAFSVDGVSPAINSRILVKDQTSNVENGIYTLTTVGSGAVAWVLTRAVDYDTPAEITSGNIVPIQTGTVNALTLWLQTQTVTTIGVDAIIFIKFLGQGITTINGDTGSITGTTVTVETAGNAGASVLFNGTGATMTLVTTDISQNTYIGEGCGTLSLVSVFNAGLGYMALAALTTGGANTCLGAVSGNMIESGNNNCAVGISTLANVVSGSSNLAFGNSSGFAYTTSESNNIIIGNTGTIGDNNIMRLGTTGSGAQQVNTTFIAGINTVDVGSVSSVVSISGDQLGTTTITAGANITVTPGANIITIAATGMASFSWTVETIDLTMVINHGYIANKAGTLALLLPATSVVGSIIEVTGINTALGWQITQAASQQIFFGTMSTTLGTGGSLTSSATRDSIKMVCVVADTVWNVLSSVGNITVV